MSKRDDRNRRIREETREKILAGSLEVLSEKGPARASMREIAARSGVSKGLAYHYFESKEELLTIALRSHLTTLLEVTDRIRALDRPMDRLAALVDGLIEHVRKRPTVFRTAMALMLQSRTGAWAEAAEALREPIDVYLARVQDLFVELGADDPEIEAALFRSSLLGLCLRISKGEDELGCQDLRDRLVKLFGGPTSADGDSP